MRDTTPAAEALFRTHWLDLPPEKRLLLAAGMFDSARAMVLASFPPDTDPGTHRLRLCARLYGDDLAHRARGDFTPADPELVHAVESGDLPAIRRLSAAGADLNAILEGDCIFVHAQWLPPRRRRETIRTLLELGADPDGHTSGDATGLWHAVLWRDPALVALFLAFGADPTIVCFEDEDPTTALETAWLDYSIDQIDAEAGPPFRSSDPHGHHLRYRLRAWPRIIRMLEEAEGARS